MDTARSSRFRRGNRSTILLLLALLAAPAAARAQNVGSVAVLGGIPRSDLSGTDTTAVTSSRETMALSRPLVGEAASIAWSDNHASTDVTPSAAGGMRALRSLPAPHVHHDDHAIVDLTTSLSRHLLIGSGIGAATGAAFALAVVSLADCGGPDCSGQIVIGVAGHALAGAVVGALVGGVTYLVRR